MKQQWLVAIGSIILLFGLYFFGRTKPNPKGVTQTTSDTASSVSGPAQMLEQAKKQLKPNQLATILGMENAITRGDLVTQRIAMNAQLAAYWRDSVGNRLPYLYYSGEKAKLENSEKNLNFAAQSYLEALKSVPEPSVRTWMANEAQSLFDKVLKLNPANDSAKVGWGSTFIFGAGGAPMEGIMKIREVAERDSTFMYAQFMLGYGGMMTGQFDKAAERLLKVVKAEPENMEAVFLLAEAYERSGNKTEAVRWYTTGKKSVKNPELLKAIEEKIKTLQ
ncbi:MAG: tetratricopeptide repeat protein [Sphingobacteriales bacterium]|jgi:tetratricopeptide (TPR) repeat protein